MSTPLEFFTYAQGTLSCDGVSLTEVARKLGTPCYVYSARGLLEPLRELQEGLASLGQEGALICFAVKANSNLGVLKLLGDAGAGMDLVSGGELYRARRAGVPTSRMVFSGVGKTRAEITEALRAGIFSFNVESLPELSLINQVARELGVRARVSLRFNPDVDAKTHPYISTGLRKNKFGIPRREVIEIARRAGEYPGIEFHGISIHIGSQLTSLSPLNDAFKKTREMVETLNTILPHPISVIDLGGGLGITYKKEKVPSISRYCALVLKHFGPRAGLRSPVKLIFEPGRLLSGNAGVLLTQVQFRKTRGSRDFVIVDAGMNDLIRPALYQSHHEIVPIEQSLSRGSMKAADIVGPVCETADCFASGRKLSPKIGDGALLAILSTGAYGFSMSNQYNSRPRPPEVLIVDGGYRVLRTRETYEDLVRGESP